MSDDQQPTEFDRFNEAAGRVHRSPVPTISVARVMVVVAAVLFVIMKFFLWDDIHAMLSF